MHQNYGKSFESDTQKRYRRRRTSIPINVGKLATGRHRQGTLRQLHPNRIPRRRRQPKKPGTRRDPRLPREVREHGEGRLENR